MIFHHGAMPEIILYYSAEICRKSAFLLWILSINVSFCFVLFRTYRCNIVHFTNRIIQYAQKRFYIIFL